MESKVENRNLAELFEILGIEESKSQVLDVLVETDYRYLRDMKMNLKKILTSDKLSEKEIYLLGLSIAVNERNDVLIDFFSRKTAIESSVEERAEAIAIASLLSSNNVFYRFRHFVDKEKYNQIPARLRMNIMANPVLGKEFFELASLAVSAVNGCELCVKSHEASLIELGSTEKRIFDVIRLASVVVSISKIIK